MKLASRGLRDMDSGAEAVANEADRARARAQAAVVYRKALIAAAAVTAVAVLIPR